jgi:AbrB family looped-hinge helix DNA binding protein
VRVRMSTRGRVTIPKELRNKHGFSPGRHVHCWVEGDSIVIAVAEDEAGEAPEGIRSKRRSERQQGRE